MSNVPVVEAVRAAFAFRRHHWRQVVPALGVVAVGSAIDFAGELTGDSGLRLIGSLINLVATIVAYGALLRLAFVDERPEEPELQPGAGGLQWRRPETRILGVIGLMFLVGLIATTAFILVGVILVMVLLSAGLIQPLSPGATPQQITEAMTPQSAAILVGFLFACGAVVVYLFCRLILALPATISRGKVAVFETWALTKGQAWRIFAAVVLSNAPSIAAGLLLAVLVSILAGSGAEGEAVRLALPAALPLAVIWGVVAGFIQLPVTIGLSAYLYRGLRPADESVF